MKHALALLASAAGALACGCQSSRSASGPREVVAAASMSASAQASQGPGGAPRMLHFPLADSVPPVMTAVAELRADLGDAKNREIVSNVENVVRIAGPQSRTQSRCFAVMLDKNPGDQNPGRGKVSQNDPVWEAITGLAYLRGWRPFVKGPRVGIGGEGTTLGVQTIPATSSSPNTTVRAFFIDGTSMTVSPLVAGEFQAITVTDTDLFVEIIGTPTGATAIAYSLTNPTNNQPPYDTANALKPIADMLDALRVKAFTIGVAVDQKCP